MTVAVEVTGGAGGIDAKYEDIATLARNSEDIALQLGEIAVKCHGALVDPDLLASAVLDPGGAAKFEKLLLEALDGQGGVSRLAINYGERAVTLRTASASYAAVDALQQQAFNVLQRASGPLFLASLPATLLAVLGAGGVALAEYTHDGTVDWQRLLTDHPGIVDSLVGAGPGLISMLGIPVGDVPAAAHLLGMMYPDGTPQVQDITSSSIDPAQARRMLTAPTTIGDILDGLDYRNGETHENQDKIDVRKITQPDGTVSWIADIPGTKSWNAPFSQNPALSDLGTNVHIMGGDHTSREAALAEALHQAGVGADDPVMLVGHSQGGMLATQAASDSKTPAFDYNVTHVVTAGSPVGSIDVPNRVQVLSLENKHDIVPHLDARDNPTSANRTTVTFDNQLGNIGNNHDTKLSYLPAGRALDASTDPSVVAFRNSADQFLNNGQPGATVDAHVFSMTRNTQ